MRHEPKEARLIIAAFNCGAFVGGVRAPGTLIAACNDGEDADKIQEAHNKDELPSCLHR